MNKTYKTVGVKAYIEKRDANNARLREIGDIMLAEKREATEAEQMEAEAIRRENAALDFMISGAKDGEVIISNREHDFDVLCREVLAEKKPRDFVLERTEYIHQTTSTNADAMVPVEVKNVVQPLENGMIMNLVGLPIYTGLKGSYVYPTIDAIEATVAGEATPLNDSQINFGKITPSPKRVGVMVRLTNQLINETEGVAYNIVMQQLPLAIARTLNKCMFATEGSLSLVGPFKAIAGVTGKALSEIKTIALKKSTKHVTFAGALPTYKELLALKGLVLVKGIAAENMAYVMDAYTLSQLESTPRDEGSGLMIVENGKIGGVPVFATNYINGASTTNVAFGCFGNVVCQGFGDMRFGIDPYKEMDSDIVRVAINSDWSMDTLRPEAFALGTCTNPT